jgi:hypothetical protein
MSQAAQSIGTAQEKRFGFTNFVTQLKVFLLLFITRSAVRVGPVEPFKFFDLHSLQSTIMADRVIDIHYVTACIISGMHFHRTLTPGLHPVCPTGPHDSQHE